MTIATGAPDGIGREPGDVTEALASEDGLDHLQVDSAETLDEAGCGGFGLVTGRRG